ncbi:MAG TPA: hypothetical protein PJ986_04630 [Gammaproteobacteria bacterium]|nr:hypothetical protein [Gammaproteobacteria bacterium]
MDVDALREKLEATRQDLHVAIRAHARAVENYLAWGTGEQDVITTCEQRRAIEALESSLATLLDDYEEGMTDDA